MVGVEDEVHPRHVLVVLLLADHVGEVGAHVFLGIDRDLPVAAVFQVVDEGGDDRDARDEVRRILVDELPRVVLVVARLVVRLGKLRVLLQREDAGR